MRDNAKLSLDSRLRFDVQVLKASAQSLDEIALTLTTLAMHSELAGQGSDGKLEPPQTYEITLSGPSPTFRASNGSKISPEERLKLAIFVVPLAEFYAHWGRSPTLELEPGWAREVTLPFATSLFATEHNETLRVGPLSVRFSSRPQASEDLPFELSLPVEYGSSLGKLIFDLTGTAKLSANSGRPSAFELNGPLSATGGPRGSQVSISGAAKFAATLSYP
jgi:hypothetical protein